MRLRFVQFLVKFTFNSMCYFNFMLSGDDIPSGICMEKHKPEGYAGHNQLNGMRISPSAKLVVLVAPFLTENSSDESVSNPFATIFCTVLTK